jgi:hypothetical protein
VTDHARRQSDHQDFDPGAVRNGWERKLYLAGKAVREIGVPTLMLAVFVGWLSGWIPSSISRTEAKLVEHDARLNAAVGTRAETDRKLADILLRLTGEMEQRNRRDKLRECAEIRDPDIRRECLR